MNLIAALISSQNPVKFVQKELIQSKQSPNTALTALQGLTQVT